MFKGYELSTIIEARRTLIENWGEAGRNVAKIISSDTNKYELRMSAGEFLQHCSACGGNWGGMLLTGIKRLAPEVWEAIPDNMGVNAWNCIIAVLTIMRVEF